MIDSIVKVLFGTVCIILGIKVIWKPVFFNKQWGQMIDVSGFNIPLGCGLIIFGILFIYFQLSQNKRK
jgi:hypothetical protein